MIKFPSKVLITLLAIVYKNQHKSFEFINYFDYHYQTVSSYRLAQDAPHFALEKDQQVQNCKCALNFFQVSFITKGCLNVTLSGILFFIFIQLRDFSGSLWLIIICYRALLSHCRAN